MKKYMVLDYVGASWSPIKKYESDNLEDCRAMRNLLMKEKNEDYIIVEVIE